MTCRNNGASRLQKASRRSSPTPDEARCSSRKRESSCASSVGRQRRHMRDFHGPHSCRARRTLPFPLSRGFDTRGITDPAPLRVLLPHESSTPLTRLPASLPPSAIPGKGPTAQPEDPAAWLCPSAMQSAVRDARSLQTRLRSPASAAITPNKGTSACRSSATRAGIREARGDKAVRMQGLLRMELAGLEPATSWVRSRRSPALSLGCLQGFRCGGGSA